MKRYSLASILVGTLTLIGCGDSIPQNYLGDFVEVNSGAQLSLQSQSGTYIEDSGRKLEARSFELTFKDLREGKPGVYFKGDRDRSNVLEIYWINPNLATKQEAGGIESFEAEVFYFRFNRQAQTRIDILQAIHAMDGVVSLDLPTQQFQVGWPAERPLLEFRRLPKN